MKTVILVSLFLSIFTMHSPVKADVGCHFARNCSSAPCAVKITDIEGPCFDWLNREVTTSLGTGCDFHAGAGSLTCRQVGLAKWYPDSSGGPGRCVRSSKAYLETPGCCTTPCQPPATGCEID